VRSQGLLGAAAIRLIWGWARRSDDALVCGAGWLIL
jgi:hypothetical protein